MAHSQKAQSVYLLVFGIFDPVVLPFSMEQGAVPRSRPNHSALVSRHYYRPEVPWKIYIAPFFFSLSRITYGIACAFGQWGVNPLNVNANPGWIYGLGYMPMIVVLIGDVYCGL